MAFGLFDLKAFSFCPAHFRLKDSDINIPEERASDVAKKTERELFQLYKDTDHKYKNKYRSLMFNLKDTKNNVSTFYAWDIPIVSHFTICNL